MCPKTIEPHKRANAYEALTTTNSGGSMMAKKSLAGEWMKANGHSWSKRHPNAKLKPKHEKTVTGQGVRRRRMCETEGAHAVWDWTLKDGKQTIKAFVEANRDFDGHDCLFVPAAMKNRPAALSFCGKNISAAKYMLLLKTGAPKHEGMVTRHVCGNGHLSCVNPNHLAWGTVGDNVGDAGKHRAAGDNVQDRINSID
jgi:hypothetical protein